MSSAIPNTSYATRQDSGRRRRASFSIEGATLRRNTSHDASSTVRSTRRRPALLGAIGRRFRTFRGRPLIGYRRTSRLVGEVSIVNDPADDASRPHGPESISPERSTTARTYREVEATVEFCSAAAQADVGPSRSRRQADTLLSMRQPAGRMPVVDSTENLESLVGGSIFAERYTVEEERPRGQPHCRYATDLETSQRVVLKFCVESSHEWMNAIRVHRLTHHSKYVCRLLEVVEDSDGYPPCLVLERGNYSLAERLSVRHPSAMEQRAILYSILEALEYFHSQNINHGNLNPSNIIWFSSDFTWKITDLDYASRSQEMAVVPPFMTHYTAPEVTMAYEQRKTHVQLGPATDMWSLGVIAFEMFTCSRVCDSWRLQEQLQVRRTEQSLDRAETPQRWLSVDRRGRSLYSDEEQSLCFVRNLLQISPRARQTVNEALSDRIFRSASDAYQRIDTFESLHSDGRLRLSDIFHWPEWTWLQLLNDHITYTLRVECFLKESRPSTLFHQREAQEALRFYDDYLPDHPVHILRLEKSARLRLQITPDDELSFPIEGIVSFRVGLPDEDFVELEMVQSLRGNTLEAVILFDPSRFRSEKMHVISPHFGLVDRKYVKLTVQIRILLGAPFRREVDLYRLLYCKIVHPRNRLRFHRMVGMFENQREHNVSA